MQKRPRCDIYIAALYFRYSELVTGISRGHRRDAEDVSVTHIAVHDDTMHRMHLTEAFDGRVMS